MRYLALFFALIATPLLAQPQFPLPRVYTVTGVAPDDTLNIRATPDADSLIIGSLMPEQNTEILNLTEDQRWGMVSVREAIGWVSMRFLRETPKTIGLAADLPYGLPGELTCEGSEPFWALHILTGETVRFTDYSQAQITPQTYTMLGASSPINRGVEVYAFTSPPITGFLRRNGGNRTSIEGVHGWTIYLLIERENGVTMVQGYCTALQP